MLFTEVRCTVTKCFYKSPSRSCRSACSLCASQENHLTPLQRIVLGQLRTFVWEIEFGQIAGCKILLKCAVRKRVYSHTTRDEDAGPVAKVFHQSCRLNIRVI